MYSDSSEGLNKENNKAIFFFTPSFHPLDNFSAHRIDIWNISFPTAEHAYQCKKFNHNKDISNQILLARSPEKANQIGKQHRDQIPQGWHDQKVAIMKEILRAKAEQNHDVQKALQRSGNKEIIENSPVDNFWGNGPDNDGKNMIGKIWMELRKEQTTNGK
ncbi:NADAR family protein [Patescibacteria group bacterium]|nr:NADAR family protein [Patescibacteria group bacterium]MBU1890388.1 NADAR family protein [Patescibacteria group bacterium]